MPSISLTNPENVINLTLGSASNPKIGGRVDLSKFLDLTYFNGNSLDLTAIVGFENLSKLEFFYITDNLLDATPIPTLDKTALVEFDISNQTSGDGGPTDIVEGWSVPESIMKFNISDTAIGGDDDDGAVKLKILTAFYHVFKDFDAGSKAGGQILADNTGGIISVNGGLLYAPYGTDSPPIDITTALTTLNTVGFTFTANEF